MTIPFVIPAQFMAKVMSGEYVRYGGIIKDVVSGQVVGHLKEAGSLGNKLSVLSVNPYAAGIQAAMQTIQYADLSRQLHQLSQEIPQIQSTLEGLQLITSVGALASVASLGVCVAGFSTINNKLKKVECKLDDIFGELSQVKKIAQRSEIKLDALSLGRLRAAAEELSHAEEADKEDERIEYARSAEDKFRKIKHYYSILMNEGDYNAWNDPELPLPESLELHSRVIAAIQGELYASFLRGDFGAYRSVLEKNTKLAHAICHFDKTTALRNRVADSFFTNTKEVADAINRNHSIALENFARIESMGAEASYVQRNNLTPIQYIKELKQMKPDLLLLPSS